MKLLNYSIATSYPVLSLDRRTIINTLNPHSYCIARKDASFQKALKASDILLPDGIGIVLAAKVLKRQNIKKIAGYDVFLHIMDHLNQVGGSCFFLGASEQTLVLISRRLKQDYPDVNVASYSPPYKAVFSKTDSSIMCKEVNKSNAQVLFVGMTAPKQEKWVEQHKTELKPQSICSIGAVFDFYAGTVKRSHPIWIKLGLEWLPRFLKDPKRLAERNLVSTPKFIMEVISYKFFKKPLL